MDCSLIDKVLEPNRVYEGIIVKEKNGHRVHINWNDGPNFFERVGSLINAANLMNPKLAAEIVCVIKGRPAELKARIKALNLASGLPGVCQKT